MTTVATIPANGILPASSGLPAYLQTAQAPQTWVDSAARIAIPRISTEGGMFQIMLDGNAIGGKHHELQAVILDIGPSGRDTLRSYYAGTWTKGSKDKPVCWSANGKTPDPSVKTPQSASCQTCPKNAKGSGTNGTIACRFGKLLALASPADPSTVLQMRLSSSAIFAQYDAATDSAGLLAYATMIAKTGAPPTAIVTKIWFPHGGNEGARFTMVGYLHEAGFNAMNAALASEECKLAVSVGIKAIAPDAENKDPVAQAPVAQAPVAQAPVAQAPVAQAPVAQAPVVQAPVVQAPVAQAPSESAPSQSAVDARNARLAALMAGMK